MAILDIVRRRLKELFRAGDLNRELDNEMRFHVDMQTEENIRAGMSPAEARRQAALQFGGMDGHQEAVRDSHSLHLARDFVRDAGYAARGLLRTPVFSYVAVLTLAFAIGLNAGLFGLLSAFFLRPPPGLTDTDRLTQLSTYGFVIEQVRYPQSSKLRDSLSPSKQSPLLRPGRLAFGQMANRS